VPHSRAVAVPTGLRRWLVSPLRWHFLFVLVLSLGVGGALYAVPSLGASFWPYPIKPLGIRFFSSVFLAVSVASLFVLRESRRGTADVLLVMGVSVFGMIVVAAVADFPRLTLRAASALWALLLASLAAASLLFLIAGRRETTVGGPPVPRWLHRHFLLHTVVVLFFALQMLFTPSVAKAFWPWAISDTVQRGIGGLFCGVAIGTAWSFRQRSWDRVRLLLPVNITFVSMVLLAVGIHWADIAAGPGWQVTIPWLLLYVYTAAYPAYYLLRPPTGAPSVTTPASSR